MEESKKSYWVTYILVLLFGYTGAHNFYLGKTKRGFLYLCSLVFILPAIYFWLKDAYLIFAGGLTDGEGGILPSYKAAVKATAIQKTADKYSEGLREYSEEMDQKSREHMAEAKEHMAEAKEHFKDFKEVLTHSKEILEGSDEVLEKMKEKKKQKLKKDWHEIDEKKQTED